MNFPKSPTCSAQYASGQGPDLFFQFTPSSSGPFTFTAVPTTPSFDVAIGVLTDCPSSSTVTTCAGFDDRGAGGATETLTVNLVAGHTYFVAVDGYIASSGSSVSAGAFSLRVDVGATTTSSSSSTGGTGTTGGNAGTTGSIGSGTTGASCPVVTDMGTYAPGGSRVITGNTRGRPNDYDPSCLAFGGASGDGDQGLLFTVAQNASFAATVTATESGYEPAIALYRGCQSVELACSDSVFADGTSIAVNQLTPGSYVLVVDGASSFFGNEEGAYRLQVSFDTPVVAPPNEVCSSASSLAGSTLSDGGLRWSGTVDLRGARDDTTTSLTGACNGTGHGGDVAYRIDLTQPVASLTITGTRGSGTLRPVLSLQPSPCRQGFDAGFPEVACAVDPNDGGPTRVTTGPLQAGTYYLWVDSWSGTSGVADFSVTAP